MTSGRSYGYDSHVEQRGDDKREATCPMTLMQGSADKSSRREKVIHHAFTSDQFHGEVVIEPLLWLMMDEGSCHYRLVSQCPEYHWWRLLMYIEVQLPLQPRTPSRPTEGNRSAAKAPCRLLQDTYGYSRLFRIISLLLLLLMFSCCVTSFCEFAW